MLANSAIDTLRQRIASLEETQRRLWRTVPVADAVDGWLPNGGLPTGCIHEVSSASLASAIVFCAILSARIARDRGNILYIAPDQSYYPLGLLPYGVRLDQVLHISARRPQNRIWAVMEALRCPEVSSVFAVTDDLDLTESRRLQLAAETSGATGFLICNAATAHIAAPITRWKISSTRGGPECRFDEPVWTLDLLYCRGGRPGTWKVEWRGEKLHALLPQPVQRVSEETLAG
jgi:protein ImuA